MQGPAVVGAFESERMRLRAVAHRILGSSVEAEDAVQEAWLRLDRHDGEIDNLAAWLTTVVSRICLDQLRARSRRPEDEYDEGDLPTGRGGASVAPIDPADRVEHLDAVERALIVMVDVLNPVERVIVVLHDVFAVPFDEIAAVVDRPVAHVRKTATRARQKLLRSPEAPAAAPPHADHVVRTFLDAARGGDLTALVRALHPEVTLRSDGGALHGYPVRVFGATAVAAGAMRFAPLAAEGRLGTANGVLAAVTTADGVVDRIMCFTVVDGAILDITMVTHPDRIAEVLLETTERVVGPS
jgi:RNA polymerase sigma factor (sigma-70 family)